MTPVPTPDPTPTAPSVPVDLGVIGSLFTPQAGGLSGWAILFAVLSIVLAWVLAVLAARAVRAVLSRFSGITPAMVKLSARIVKYAIIVFGVGIALTFLGAPIQPLLAATLLVAVVLALALRGFAEDFAAGVMLQTRRPFTVGDEIETNDVRGIVHDINARSVILRTADGETVHVPNALVLSEPMTNYSEAHGRRFDIEVRVAGAGALDDAVRQTLLDALRSAEGLHKRPEPMLLLVASDPLRATFEARVWVAPDRYPAAIDIATTALARAARDNGIDATVIWPVPPQPLSPPSPH